MKNLIFLLLFCMVLSVKAQNGPAGVGNTSGSSGQPQNSLWLKADGLSNLNDGDKVSVWPDNSGNGNNALQADINKQPDFRQNIFNGMPVLRFDGSGANTGDRLIIKDADNLDNSGGISIICVIKPTNIDGIPRALLSKRAAYNVNDSYNQFFYTSNLLYNDIAGPANRFNSHFAFSNDSLYIMELFFDGSKLVSERSSFYYSGDFDAVSPANTTTIPNNASDLYLGKLGGAADSSTLGGDYAELIIYRAALLTAQRIIVENYLSSKYDIPVTFDRYAGDTFANGDYDFSVIGIGKESGGSHLEAQRAGLAILNNSFLTDNGDYVLAGHNAGSNAYSNNDVAQPVGRRWTRVWYIDRTDGGANANGNIRIAFDYSDGQIGTIPSTTPGDYRLLYRTGTSGNFSAVSTVNTTVANDSIMFDLAASNLVDGYYTIGLLDIPPTVANPIADVTVDEDAANTIIDLTNVFTDVDDDPALITKAVQSNSNPTLVSATINGNTLTLDYQPDQNGTSTITIRATSDGKTVDDQFLVTVNAVNDPPTVVNPIADVTVDEDAANTVINLTNVFTDVDNDPALITKTVQSNSNPTLVSATINGNTLTLDYQPDKNGTSTITIRGTSGGQTVDDQFLVTVNAINDPPTVANPIADVTVDEDAANTVINLTNVFTDVDNDPALITKAVQVNSNPTLVSATINGNTLTLDYQPEQSGTANITIRATSGGQTVDDQFVVTVNTIDDPPTVANPIADVTVAEDAANTVINLANVFTDVDNDPALITKTVQANSNPTLVSATINGNTLTLDYQQDQNGTANITIRATSGGKTVDDQFVVTVNAVNDPPTVANPIADVTVNEDAANTVINLANVFTDVDNDPALITKAVQANSNPTLVSATINGNTLTLDYQPEQSGTANITIRATSGGQTVDDQFVVTVNTVNDPPTVANPIADVTVAEDAANTVINLANVFTDVDNDPALITKAVQANSNPTLVSATINGNTLTLDYQPDKNGTANITIRATSGGQTVDDQFVVTVNAVDDPPTVANPIADVTVNEDAANTVIDLTDVFADVDNDPALITKAVQQNNNPTLVTATISNGNTLTLDYQPNQHGVATIAIRGTSGGQFVDNTFQVTVNSVNDPPTVANPIADVTVDEDAANTVIDLSDVFNDLDNDPALITKAVQANSNPTLVNATIEGNTLTLDYQPNQNGTANITIRGTSGGQTVDDQFVVTVNSVNDPPTVANPIADVTVDEDAANTVIDLTDVFEDTDNDPVLIVKTVQANSNPTLVDATVDGNTLTLDYQQDQNGTADITIRATSGGQTVDAEFVVTVNAVNDPPTVANPIADVTVEEDAANTVIDLTDVFTDVDDEPAQITITLLSNSNPTLVNATLDGDSLTLDYQPEQSGTANITIQATSGEQTVDEQFVVTVNAVNDPPIISTFPPFSFNEDDSLKSNILDFYEYVSDPDTPDSLLSFTYRNGKHVQAILVAAEVILKSDLNWNGKDTLTVKVSDGELMDSTEIYVTVHPINDAPELVGLPDTLKMLNTLSTQLVMKDYLQDADLPNDHHTWVFDVSDDTVKYEFDDGTTTLTLQNEAFVGIVELYITVTDDSMASVKDTIMLDIKNDPTGLGEMYSNIPDKHILYQNYPNPFNPLTNIKFGLPKAEKVVIDIYNILGQKVMRLFSGPKSAGYHIIEFNAGSLPSGVYFYRLETESFHKVSKMVLLK